MTRSDFAWVNFDHSFADGESVTRGFQVDGTPADAQPDNQELGAEGYLLIQAEAVGKEDGGADDGARSDNKIAINGRDLPAFDLIRHEGLNLWMDRIPQNFLRVGNNRLTITACGDRFRILNVVVQWRETTSVVGATDFTAEVEPA